MSAILEPIDSPFLVPFDGKFKVSDASTKPPEEMRDLGKKKHREKREKAIAEMREFQRAMYAHDRWSLLLVFQAMDAAGKDGTIRRVATGLNPAGCQVSSFKAPSDEELDHDFLWRVQKRLPERGQIGIFNRSHYEEVLVVKVHPEYLERQRLPGSPKPKHVFPDRYEAIRSWEHHLARSGTVILKFWLNVGYDEQRQRFLDRIDEPDSRWKFNEGDVRERRLWPKYMEAYEHALNETSRAYAPWYAIPADDKPFMRRAVAEIVLAAMKRMEPSYPLVDEETEKRMLELREELVGD